MARCGGVMSVVNDRSGGRRRRTDHEPRGHGRVRRAHRVPGLPPRDRHCAALPVARLPHLDGRPDDGRDHFDDLTTEPAEHDPADDGSIRRAGRQRRGQGRRPHHMGRSRPPVHPRRLKPADSTTPPAPAKEAFALQQRAFPPWWARASCSIRTCFCPARRSSSCSSWWRRSAACGPISCPSASRSTRRRRPPAPSTRAFS